MPFIIKLHWPKSYFFPSIYSPIVSFLEYNAADTYFYIGFGLQFIWEYIPLNLKTNYGIKQKITRFILISRNVLMQWIGVKYFQTEILFKIEKLVKNKRNQIPFSLFLNSISNYSKLLLLKCGICYFLNNYHLFRPNF